MTKKDLVDEIGMQTGISKRDLAGWIGTHHSILSRYLAGTRSLPLKAVQQLLFLHQYLSDLPPLPAATPDAATIQMWQEQAQHVGQKMKEVEDKYTSAVQNWQAASRALQLLTILANDVFVLTPKQERWIEEQRYQAEKQLADNDPVVQQKLRIQIVLLQKEKELWEELVGEQGGAA